MQIFRLDIAVICRNKHNILSKHRNKITVATVIFGRNCVIILIKRILC